MIGGPDSLPHAAIRFDDLTLGYDRHPAVHHLGGTIPAGSLLAIVGPNGAGKSTLLKGVAGALAPLHGRIEITRMHGGERARIAYLPQLTALDRTFPISVADVVASGLWHKAGLFRRIGNGENAAIDEALSAAGLAGFEQRWIGSLSGGQFQRALFARLMLQDAPIILLDEPLNAVDDKTAADLIDVVKRWQAESRTVLAALHDLHVVRSVFPETLLLAREAIAWGRTDEVLTPSNLTAARRMSEVFDEHAHECARSAA
ncbi:MAG: zinc/manganese transport system ATP-binding protein [Methylobacteriaceae bacterium]|jgi:zinc/manganese transport system ATP-binding protein|nr:zinc/manganese transport system ATP-binding protein [Methylobacteriaceae bacterium]